MSASYGRPWVTRLPTRARRIDGISRIAASKASVSAARASGGRSGRGRNSTTCAIISAVGDHPEGDLGDDQGGGSEAGSEAGRAARREDGSPPSACRRAASCAAADRATGPHARVVGLHEGGGVLHVGRYGPHAEGDPATAPLVDP